MPNACSSAGAHGYLMKGADLDGVVQALDAVLRGEIVLSPRMNARILARRFHGAPQVRYSDLSNREMQIFLLIGAGLTTDRSPRTSISAQDDWRPPREDQDQARPGDRLRTGTRGSALRGKGRLGPGPAAVEDPMPATVFRSRRSDGGPIAIVRRPSQPPERASPARRLMVLCAGHGGVCWSPTSSCLRSGSGSTLSCRPSSCSTSLVWASSVARPGAAQWSPPDPAVAVRRSPPRRPLLSLPSTSCPVSAPIPPTRP